MIRGLYPCRRKLLMLAYKLHNKLLTIEDESNKRSEYKFLLEVFKNTPIASNSSEDESNITKSILTCYSRSRASGRLDCNQYFHHAGCTSTLGIELSDRESISLTD